MELIKVVDLNAKIHAERYNSILTAKVAVLKESESMV
jgi:hypothetical protein